MNRSAAEQFVPIVRMNGLKEDRQTAVNEWRESPFPRTGSAQARSGA